MSGIKSVSDDRRRGHASIKQSLFGGPLSPRKLPVVIDEDSERQPLLAPGLHTPPEDEGRSNTKSKSQVRPAARYDEDNDSTVSKIGQ